ncbi:MAG: undecaprenyl-phosphate glucose phosphotransferase [Methylobacteriaceae bacterium]|nr:undecaprenyl-phosphate glucose phosphotransferase [Methylobacteriaceae bacterium]
MAASTPQDVQRHDAVQRSAGVASPRPGNGAFSAAARRRSVLAETFVGTTRPAWSPIVLAGIVRIVEFVLIALTGAGVHLFYIAPTHGYEAAYLIAVPAIAAAAVVMFQALDINHVNAFRHPLMPGFRLAGGWSLVILGMLAVVFFSKLEGVFSRVWLGTWYVLGLAVVLLWRGILSIIVQELTRRGKLDRRTAVVGGGEAGEALLRELSRQNDTELVICGVFDDRMDDRSPDVVGGYPRLGTVDDLVEFARRVRLDLVIFTLPITAEERLLAMLRKLWVLPVDIRLAAHTNKLRFRPRSYSYIGHVPVLDVLDKPIADWDVVMKWAFDKIVGTIALVLLSPILLVAAIAVKLDSPGPILFKQKRYGFNNELIEIYKFRSMYVASLDPTASRLVTRNDPRVTRVGRFIRKTSIDELPQLLNVIFKGNLSLVGPRPHAVHAKAAERMYDEVVDGYFARHRVRPGITGWAQINGWRGETDTPEKIQQRVKHDLEYIENWSIPFDLYILAVTPFALLKSEHAY